MPSSIQKLERLARSATEIIERVIDPDDVEGKMEMLALAMSGKWNLRRTPKRESRIVYTSRGGALFVDRDEQGNETKSHEF